jgi:PilZ domain-containing protein
MYLISRKPNERLLQIRRRAIFGRAVRPASQVYAPAVDPVETKPAAVAAPLTGDGIEGSRRRSRRVLVADNISVRKIGSFNFQARLQDVSTGGCRVELIEAYEVGDRVVARFPKLEPLGARICWAMGATAGIEFLNGLHPAVFDTLLIRLSGASFSKASPDNCAGSAVEGA